MIEECTQSIAAIYLMCLDFCKQTKCNVNTFDLYTKDLTNKEAQDFTINVLNFMREKLSDYQEE